MNVMICLDKGFGYAFFGRRQSKDSILRSRALELADGVLYMDAYTAGQFGEEPGIRVVEDPVREIPPEGWYFLERTDPDLVLPHTQKLAVFHWNRDYPFDRRFPLELLRERAKLLFREAFPGSSHETIDLEVYQL